MRIDITSVMVDDQAKAARFYTEKLGFVIKRNTPVGDARWLTVSSPDQADGPELLLEPTHNPNVLINGEPAARQYQAAVYEAGVPATILTVDDVDAEFQRLTRQGVKFQNEPVDIPGGRSAVLDDTCGNLIAIMEVSNG